jgi:hypothetical protein
MVLHMRNLFWGLLLLAPFAAIAAPEGVKVTPTGTEGEHVNFPRLTQFPDPAVQARVNAILAEKQAEDRAGQRDCLKQVHDQHEDMRSYAWSTRLQVTHVSRHFLRLSVSGNYDCAGAHPSDGGGMPINIDLSSGTEVDWNKAFKPGFLTTTDPKTFAAHRGKIAALYFARYAKIRGQDKDDKECLDAMHDQDFLGVALRLDEKEKGLVATPDLPFVIQACGEDITFHAGELAPYIADPNLLADL